MFGALSADDLRGTAKELPWNSARAGILPEQQRNVSGMDGNAAGGAAERLR